MFALALAVLATAASAQPIALSEYRLHLQHGVDVGIYNEIAAGWLDAGARQTWFFGRAAKPDLASSFEIGAATEIFTGLLLAQAAIEGKLHLQSTIREVLPKELPIADSALGANTMLQLATHRAGLPALPPNLLPANSDDPYADYSTQDLCAFLANYRHAEPAAKAYSTLDAGLIGDLLGRSYGQEYSELLVEKVLKPLGLEHTGFDDSIGLLAGHTTYGSSAPHWHFGALAGAAGLRSSIGDLLTFLQQNLQPQASKLRAALLLARQTQSGSREDVGLGWKIVEVGDGEQTWPLVWRASRTAGFATFLGFRTDRQQALVLLGNSDVDLSALGIAWLEQRAPPPLPDAPAQGPTAVSWDDYPGLYKVSGGSEFIVRSRSGTLSVQFRGQPAQVLRAVADDAFAGDTLALAFSRENHKVTSAVVNVGGVHLPAQRLSERAPGVAHTPLVVDAKTLRDAAGDYQLDALTLVRIRANSDGLTLQMTGRAAQPLIAFAPDRYADMDGSSEVAFKRNADGSIDRLVLSLGDIDRPASRVFWTAAAAK